MCLNIIAIIFKKIYEYTVTERKIKNKGTRMVQSAINHPYTRGRKWLTISSDEISIEPKTFLQEEWFEDCIAKIFSGMISIRMYKNDIL